MVNSKLINNADIPMVCHAIKHFRHIQKTSISNVASHFNVSESLIKSIENGKSNDISLLLKEAKFLGLGEAHIERIFKENQKMNTDNITLKQSLLRQGILQGLKPLTLARKAGYKKNLPSSDYLKSHLNVFCHISHILGESNTQILQNLQHHGINLYGSDLKSYVKRICVLHNLSLSQLAKYSGVQYPSLYYCYTHGAKKSRRKVLKQIQYVFAHGVSSRVKQQKKNYKTFIQLLNSQEFNTLSAFAKHVHINYSQIKQLALGCCKIPLTILYQVSATLNVSVPHLINMLHLLNAKPSPFQQLLGKKHIFTQSALASKSHLSSASVNYLMKGRIKASPKMLTKIAKALNVPVQQLKLMLPTNDTHMSIASNSSHQLSSSSNNDTNHSVTSTSENYTKLFKHIFNKLQSLNQKIDDDYHNEMNKVTKVSTTPVDLNVNHSSSTINHMIANAIHTYEKQHSSQILSNQDIMFQHLYKACQNNTVMKRLVLNVLKLDTPNAQLILNLVNGLIDNKREH